MDLDLVEPVADLVQGRGAVVAAELGMPERLVWRQPFPGPGLAIRVIGEVTAERLDILRRADAVLQDEIRAAGITASCGRASPCCRRSTPSA
jgi:GMP synthase (glutamine-hydrolysing)